MKRNTLVEWMRFLFSLLVVGYTIPGICGLCRLVRCDHENDREK